VRQQIVTIGTRRIEPSEQGFRVVGVNIQPRDLDQRPVSPLQRDEADPVRCDTEISAPGLTLPLSEIVG
jgi:hypothetical protein